MNIDWNDWEIEEKYSSLSDKEFEQFLIDNDVLDRFTYNLDKNHNINEYCDKINKKEGKENYLFHEVSFNWESTNEGFQYWKKIDKKWYDLHK